MHYCNSGHQAAHYPAHKKACSKIDKTRKSMEVEEQQLRAYEGDGFTMEDPFTNGVGHFWGILETRTYMRLRFALVEALQQVYTRESLEAQLHHLQDMMRLCRGDNMGLRHYVPVLLLRLDRDQECYDFAKWYETVGRRGDYDWGNMDLGFLDLKGEDAFEEVQNTFAASTARSRFYQACCCSKSSCCWISRTWALLLRSTATRSPNEIPRQYQAESRPKPNHLEASRGF